MKGQSMSWQQGLHGFGVTFKITAVGGMHEIVMLLLTSINWELVSLPCNLHRKFIGCLTRPVAHTGRLVSEFTADNGTF